MTRSSVTKFTAVLSAAALLTLAGCGSTAMPSAGKLPANPPKAGATASGEPKATATPYPYPSPEPGAGPTIRPQGGPRADAAPRGTEMDAGHLSVGGKTKTLKGKGHATVSFTKDDDVVISGVVSCPNCTRNSNIGATGMSVPLWSIKGPFEESSWIGDKEQYHKFVDDIKIEYLALDVHMDGDWELTVMDWQDLPALSGEITGFGPRAFRVDPTASSIEVDHTVNPDDYIKWLSLDVWDASGKSLTTDLKDVSGPKLYERPGIHMVSIKTPGPWSVTLR